MHEEMGYVSSVGCLNPAPKGQIKKNKPFNGSSSMNETIKILDLYKGNKRNAKIEIIDVKIL